MKKNLYEMPSTKVIELKQQGQILTGSFGAVRPEGYGPANVFLWEE